MLHHITSVNLQVRATGRVDGFALQHDLSQWFWQEFLAALEPILNEIVPENELIRLDKLELVIPDLSADHWQEALSEALIEALREQIEQVKNNTSAMPEGARNQLPVSESHFEAWLFFLEHGRFPLPYTAAPEAERLTAVLENVAANTPAARALSRLLQRNAIALQRLVLQHDTAFLIPLSEALSGKKMNDLEQGQHYLFQVLTEAAFVRFIARLLPKTDKQASITPLEKRPFERIFWQEAFVALATAPQSFDIQVFVGKMFETTFQNAFNISFEALLEKVAKPDVFSAKSTGSPLNKLEKIIINNAQNTPLEGYFKQTLQAARSGEADNRQWNISDAPLSVTPLNSLYSSKEKEEQRPILSETSEKEEKSIVVKGENPAESVMPFAHKAEDHQAPNWDETPEAAERNALTTTQKPTAAQPKDTHSLPDTAGPEPDVLYIQDAGLVLLHPFLPTLFASQHLIQAGIFVDDTARAKAVQWLHYLATGTTDCPEHALSLPKLLCGMPSSQPIDRQNLLSADDLQEGDTLLQAIVKHWGALGNVGNDSLREGFLRRDGKLTRRDDGGWRLQVETKTLDILLSRLPWGIGLIKLKWMKNMLHVEWN